jgi:hypothetical protein
VCFPPSLSNLRSLESLSLSADEFSFLVFGSVKKLICGMTQLTALSVYSLIKTETPECLSALSCLRKLKLLHASEQVVNGMCAMLTQFESLSFQCSEKVLSLDSVVSSLACLTHLNLCSSYFEHLPDTVGELRALQVLDLRWCGSLLSLPDSLSKLHHLHELHVAGCHKLIIPHWLAASPCLLCNGHDFQYDHAVVSHGISIDTR